MEESPDFYPRQFGAETTRPQKIFDITFGILLPVLCLYFDPLMFSFGKSRFGMWSTYQAAAYMFITQSILLLAFWLGWSRPWIAAFMAGPFVAAGIVSFGIGLRLFPYTVVGIFVYGIGLLGLVPLATSFVFLRNAFRAWRRGKEQLGLVARVFCVAITSILMSAPAVALQIQSGREVQRILTDPKNESAIRRASWISRGGMGPVLSAFQSTDDSSRKEDLRKAYLRVTGIPPVDRKPSSD